MRTTILLAAALSAAASSISESTAQEGHWIANRRTNDMQQIDPGGNVLQTVSLGTNLRSAHLAPDGKVWVVRFIQGTLDLLDPATGIVTPIANGTGNPYSVAFDRAGHAWVSGGTSVQEYDANGTPLASYPLAAPAPLGITVDNQGNKWIAHRSAAPNAGVSRIDATTGVVTFHPLPSTTAMLPVDVVADYRGFTTGAPSRIWVTGDSSGDLAEFDDQGNLVNVHATGLTSVSGVATDLSGHIWVLARAGLLNEYDATATLVNSWSLPTTDALGVAVDFLGRIWVTDRVTFNCTTGTCPPCLVHRIDPRTGAIEVPAEVGIGTQSDLSTLFHHAAIVDPLGDLDGDSLPNIIEIQNGLSPVDPQSRSIGVNTTGITQLGGMFSIDVISSGPTTSSVLFATATAAPTTIPGIAGTLQIALPAPVALPIAANSYSLSLTVPNDPTLVGVALYLQGVIFTGPSGLELANRTSLRFW